MRDTKGILNKLKILSGKTKNNYFGFFLLFILVIFLFLNIYYSQNISPLFFGITNNEEKSTVEFLQKIKESENFNTQLNYFKNIFGDNLQKDVFAKEIERNSKIKELEQILEKSPKSRDVLYYLSQLYLQENNLEKAKVYLKLSKEIDPEIN